jgi:hypothetical protein
MSSESSRISRVVPGRGVTIAASRWATHGLDSLSLSRFGRDVPRKLRRVLLPAFGGPKMVRRIPDRRISPLRLSDKWARMVWCRFLARSRAAA